MNKPLVSVIIPVYNNERFLDKCIRSVCAQKYDNLEIIIINDGSTDRSLEIINIWKEKDSRLIVIDQENRGVSGARNAGIDKASGEYITFIDGDDYVGPMYIYRLVRSAVTNDSDMVLTGLMMQNEDGTVIRSIIPGGYVKNKHEEWIFRVSAVACHLYKKEIWDRYGVRFYEGVRGEDMPVSLFFSAACRKISIVKKDDYYYIQHSESAMHSFKSKAKSFLPYDALEEMIIRIRESNLEYDQNFHELFVLRIISSMIDIARGATRSEAKKLADYTGRIIKQYYPDCHKNPLIRLNSGLDIPLSQRMIVRILVGAYRINALYPLILIFCKIP